MFDEGGRMGLLGGEGTGEHKQGIPSPQVEREDGRGGGAVESGMKDGPSSL